MGLPGITDREYVVIAVENPKLAIYLMLMYLHALSLSTAVLQFCFHFVHFPEILLLSRLRVFSKRIICRMQLSICLWSTISRGQGVSGWAVLAPSLLLRLTLPLGRSRAGHPARPQHQPSWPSCRACCRTSWHRGGTGHTLNSSPGGKSEIHLNSDLGSAPELRSSCGFPTSLGQL